MERYEAYKDSGVEWIGEIPAYWQVMPIRALATYNDETLPEATDPEYRFDYIDISSVSEGSIDSHSEQVFSSAPSRARRIVRRRDVLVSTVRTYLKAIALVDEKHDGQIASTGFCVLRPKSDTNSRWFGYAVSEESVIDEIVARSVGVSYPAINASDLVRLQLRCPPIEEQRAIADYLDAKTAEVDALVADCEREVGLLREYRKAVISQAVTKGLDPDAPMRDSGVEWIGEIPEGWELSRVGWLSLCLNGDRGVNYPSGEDMQDEGVPFVVTDALHGDEIDQNRCKFITEERYQLLGGVKLHMNDIAYCLRGSVGTCAINTFANEGTVASSLMAIRPISCNSNWLYYVLISEIVSKQVESYMNGTCAANLSAEGVSKFRIPLPLNNEQVAIADYLDAITTEIDSLIDAKQSMADRLREYRKSLISEAVTGKFKVPGA